MFEIVLKKDIIRIPPDGLSSVSPGIGPLWTSAAPQSPLLKRLLPPTVADCIFGWTCGLLLRILKVYRIGSTQDTFSIRTRSCTNTTLNRNPQIHMKREYIQYILSVGSTYYHVENSSSFIKMMSFFEHRHRCTHPHFNVFIPSLLPHFLQIFLNFHYIVQHNFLTNHCIRIVFFLFLSRLFDVLCVLFITIFLCFL